MSHKNILTTSEAAHYLGLKPNTLEHWRTTNKGPRYVYVGREIRYRRSDIDDWLKTNTPHPRKRNP